MKILKWCSLVLVVCMLMVSCGDQAREKFKELCRKEAGLFINETVRHDGYYDTKINCPGCIIGFMSSDYMFFEFCNKSNKYGPLKEDGCWRIYKSTINDPLCDQNLTNSRSSWTKENTTNFCIASEKIESPLAYYSYSTYSEKIVNFPEDDKYIYKIIWEVRNTKEESLIAYQIDFRLATKNPLAGGYTSRGCGSDTSNKIPIDENFLIKAIVPVSKKES